MGFTFLSSFLSYLLLLFSASDVASSCSQGWDEEFRRFFCLLLPSFFRVFFSPFSFRPRQKRDEEIRTRIPRN